MFIYTFGALRAFDILHDSWIKKFGGWSMVTSWSSVEAVMLDGNGSAIAYFYSVAKLEYDQGCKPKMV